MTTRKTWITSYVPCPKCGDVATSRISEPSEKRTLTCSNCHHTFAFDQNDVVSNTPVSYNPETKRTQPESFSHLMR